MSTREEQWEDKLAIPVLIAALASVPAVFLTLFDDPYATVGTVTNWLSGAVLIGETVVLFAVSGDKRDWLKRHGWLVLLTLGIVIALILALGPVQLLRLIRAMGALRVIRAGRIVKAGRILRERADIPKGWMTVISIGAAGLVAVFVAVILADPTSQSRELLDRWLGSTTTVVLVVVAGVLLAGATFVVMRYQRRREPD